MSDGVNTYTYDGANRLIEVNGQVSYAYDGLGNRLQQTVDEVTTTYTLDINTPLTQILSDGMNTYLYGIDRISQQNQVDTEYFLGDALGSVRQLANGMGDVALTRAYDPYGNTILSVGDGQTEYGYTGEFTDPTGLVYLRARMYDPEIGLLLTKDSWQGNDITPMSYNAWLYAYANPINLTDPSGNTTHYYRDTAAEYASNYANSINPYYGSFTGADCTSFVSQALKAGGFPDSRPQWYFDSKGWFGNHRCSDNPWDAHCGTAWASTDELWSFLTQTENFPWWEMYGTETRSNRKVIPKSSEQQLTIPANTSLGDVVFYRQVDSAEVTENNAFFNHAAMIVSTTGQITINGKPQGYGNTLQIADHDGAIKGIKAINDTHGWVDILAIVHIPDEIPLSPQTSSSSNGNDCIYSMFSSPVK